MINISVILCAAAGIFGSIISSNGACYLVKDSGGLLTKDALTTGSSDNLFSFNLTFIDNI